LWSVPKGEARGATTQHSSLISMLYLKNNKTTDKT
jgi:hypothetical protein